MDIISQFSKSLEGVITHLTEDLHTIRTGRANGSIFESLSITTYGGQTTLKLLELATIMTEGPSVIAITPYDPSTTQDIERAILKSPLGMSPLVQGNKILIKIPSLSEEQRHKFVKLVNQKAEEMRVMCRNIRDEIRKKIKVMEEDKKITEDDKYRLEKEIDEIIQKTNEKILSIRDKKEQEIMMV